MTLDRAPARPPRSTATLTRAARAVTELELDDFALLFDTPAAEVEAWERGTAAPPAIGLRLLSLILTRPDVCLHLLDTPEAV